MTFYLGVDPSLTNTGVAILKEENDEYFLIEHHLIKTKPTQAYRLLTISQMLNKICRPFKFEKAFIEYPLINCNPKTSTVLAIAVGAIASELEKMDLKPIFLMPSEIKKIVTTQGNADKDLMKKCIKNHINIAYHLDDLSHHEIDACGIAYAGIALKK